MICLYYACSLNICLLCYNLLYLLHGSCNHTLFEKEHLKKSSGLTSGEHVCFSNTAHSLLFEHPRRVDTFLHMYALY